MIEGMFQRDAAVRACCWFVVAGCAALHRSGRRLGKKAPGVGWFKF